MTMKAKTILTKSWTGIKIGRTKLFAKSKLVKTINNMSSLNWVPSNTKTSYIKNKCEISSPLTYLCDNETSEWNQEYGKITNFMQFIGSNLQCNKHLDYASKNKRNGRSKSNSVNHSHHNNSRIGNFLNSN